MWMHSWLQRRQHWRWPEVARNICSTEVLPQRKRIRQWWLPINRKEDGISRRGGERSRRGGWNRAWPGSRCSPQKFRDVAKQVKLLIIITKIVMLLSVYKILLDLRLFFQGRWQRQGSWLEWKAHYVWSSFNCLKRSTPTLFTPQSKFFLLFSCSLTSMLTQAHKPDRCDSWKHYWPFIGVTAMKCYQWPTQWQG